MIDEAKTSYSIKDEAGEKTTITLDWHIPFTPEKRSAIRGVIIPSGLPHQ